MPPAATLMGTSSFSSHSSTSLNAPGFGATAMMVLMRSMGRNLMGEFFSESDIGFGDVFQFLRHIRGPAILHVKHVHTLVGELIAIKHGHQLHGAAHAALAVEHQ